MEEQQFQLGYNSKATAWSCADTVQQEIFEKYDFQKIKNQVSFWKYFFIFQITSYH